METVRNVKLIDKEDCTGCHACFNACPVHAISMLPDNEGFLHPLVNDEICIDCEQCLYSCPISSKPNVFTKKEVYAAYAKDDEEHATSSSGGVFSVLARYILRNGGYVCGAAFDEAQTLKHILVNTEKELQRIKGTKYVQSEIGDCFSGIKDLLDKGVVVLFSGTPCQVGGLKSFLHKEYDNLLTVDLICHGVPSPEVFRRYLEEMSEGRSVEKISFRDKSRSINDIYLTYQFSDNTIIQEKYSDSEYIKGFIQNLTIRPSCFRCRFKGSERCSDITIGDYWGINDFHPEMINDLGTSAVLIHSERGNRYFEQVKDELKCVLSKTDSVSFWNPCMEHSVEYNPSRELFFENFKEIPVKENVNRLYRLPEKQVNKTSLTNRVLRKIKRVMDNLKSS